MPKLGGSEIEEVFRQLDCFMPGDIENCAALFTDGIGVSARLTVWLLAAASTCLHCQLSCDTAVP